MKEEGEGEEGWGKGGLPTAKHTADSTISVTGMSAINPRYLKT